MRALVVLRPEPGWSATADAARAEGLHVAGRPLFRVEPADWTLPDDPSDALLVGSANAFRHGGPQLAALAHLPVHCVGRATAAEAQRAGFRVASVGKGGLQSVIDSLPADMRLLRLAGQDRVDLALPDGVAMEERVVYRVVASSLECEDVPEGSLVTLHSARAAEHFAAEIDRLSLDRADYALAALGARIAESAGTGWQSVHISPTPDDAALLAMANALCQ